MKGIYKITNIKTNAVYIGQSSNIKNRWKYYMKLKCKKQCKLYESFIKFGLENFKFEILEISNCSATRNIREQYWIDYYDSTSSFHLNMKKGGGVSSKKERICSKVSSFLNKKIQLK